MENIQHLKISWNLIEFDVNHLFYKEIFTTHSSWPGFHSYFTA